MRWNALAGAVGLLLVFEASAEAACQCACVAGRVEAICENAIDLKPVCGPQICPITPPSVRPIQAPTVPPVGTSSCAPRQVYDAAAGRYEWQTLCR